MRSFFTLLLLAFGLTCFSQTVPTGITLRKGKLPDHKPHARDYFTKMVYDYNDGEFHSKHDTAHIYYTELSEDCAILNDEILIVFEAKQNRHVLRHVIFDNKDIIPEDSAILPFKEQDLGELYVLEYDLEGKVLAVILYKREALGW